VSRNCSSAVKGSAADIDLKSTYADAAFIPWENTIHKMLADKLERYKEYPHYNAWLDRLMARPAVQKFLELRAEAMAAAPKH
jgi:glutathione S-transferase